MRLAPALLLLAATALPAQSPPQAPTKSPADTILQQEQQFWTSYAAGNTDALSRQLLPTFTP